MKFPGSIPMLTLEQEQALNEAHESLSNAEADVAADGMSVEECYADLVDSVGYDLTDPLVRSEFYRTTGCIDRSTGYDPMADF